MAALPRRLLGALARSTKGRLTVSPSAGSAFSCSPLGRLLSSPTAPHRGLPTSAATLMSPARHGTVDAWALARRQLQGHQERAGLLGITRGIVSESGGGESAAPPQAPVTSPAPPAALPPNPPPPPPDQYFSTPLRFSAGVACGGIAVLTFILCELGVHSVNNQRFKRYWEEVLEAAKEVFASNSELTFMQALDIARKERDVKITPMSPRHPAFIKTLLQDVAAGVVDLVDLRSWNAAWKTRKSLRPQSQK